MKIEYLEFEKLINNVTDLSDKGVVEMNAIEFVTRLRKEHNVLSNINEYLFGV